MPDVDVAAVPDPVSRRRSLVAIIACMSIVGITLGLTYPLLSLILEARGHPRTMIGLNAAMPAVAMLLLAPILPRIIAAAGLKPFLVACIAAEAILILALKAFDDIGSWFPLRFAMGVTTAGLFIAGETWINQVALDAVRGRMMAIYSIAFTSGLAGGPLVLATVGTEGWTPFLIGAACNVAGIVPLLAVRGEAPRLHGRPRFGVLGFVRLAPSLCAAVFAFAAVESATGALLPVYAVRSGYAESTAATMLTVLLVGGIVLQWPVGWLADHTDRYRLIGALGLAAFLSVALVPVSAGTPFALYPLFFVWGGLAAGIYTVALTIQGQRFRGPDLVVSNAAFGVMWGIASMAGPALAGGAMDIWDPHGLPVVLTAISLLFVLIVAVRHFASGGVRKT